MKMLRQCELQETISYLKKDVSNCLYLYIDLMRYGLDNSNMKVWIDRKEGEINLVLMKYHDGFQIYAGEPGWDKGSVVDLVREYKPERIAGNEPVIRELEKDLAKEYHSIYGKIFCQRKERFQQGTVTGRCEMAGVDDIPEIVDLLLTEKEFGDQYTKKELETQFEERFRTEMGRSMVMRDRGKIVAHVGTFAEADTVAVTSGAVVRKEYRKTDCLEILDNQFYDFICRQKGMDAYFFVTNKRMIRLFDKVFGACTSYGKLIRNEMEGEKE